MLEREHLKPVRTRGNAVKDQLQSQSDAKRRQQTIRGSAKEPIVYLLPSPRNWLQGRGGSVLVNPKS